MMRALTIVAVAVVAVVAHADPANAQSADGQCEVYEIEASGEAGGMDKQLGKLAGKLSKPPFTAYKSFKLVQKHDTGLQLKTPLKLTLATGGSMELHLKDKSVEKGKKPRLRLGVNIDSKQGKRVVGATTQIDSGDSWLIAGVPVPGKQDAVYVFGLVCTAK
jgi:hypothetical protein